VYLGLPGKPGTPTFTDVMDTSLVLRWTAPEDNGGAEIISYVIQCRTENEVDWRPATGDKVAKTEHALTQLKTNVVYQFKVAAVNKVGTGPFSEPSEPVRVKEVVGSFPRFFLAITSTGATPGGRGGKGGSGPPKKNLDGPRQLS